MKHSILRPLLLMIGILALNNFCFSQTNPDHSTLRVIILRHAEKPDKGHSLSCQGINRSAALVNVLYDKFKLPSYIFVPAVKGSKKTKHARMSQTIDPFATKYKLSIDSKFGIGEEAGLAKYILEKTGTVLVVWEHTNIPAIAQGLGITGGDKKLKWKGRDFDTIWIITFKNGKAELATDKENINPSPNCK